MGGGEGIGRGPLGGWRMGVEGHGGLVERGKGGASGGGAGGHALGPFKVI